MKQKTDSEESAIRGVIRLQLTVSGIHCQRQKSGSRPQDHVQDSYLCLFSKYLFFEKNRNCLQTGYQLHVAAGRSESS